MHARSRPIVHERGALERSPVVSQALVMKTSRVSDSCLGLLTPSLASGLGDLGRYSLDLTSDDDYRFSTTATFSDDHCSRVGDDLENSWGLLQTLFRRQLYIRCMKKEDYSQSARRSCSKDSGFTLIELLIVIVVLGILAAVVVFALGGVTSKSAKASCAADAKTVETAIAAYQAQTGLTPTANVDTQATSVAATYSLNPTTGTDYLRSWPNNSTHYYIGIGMTGTSPFAATSTEVDIAPGNTTGTPPAQGTANGWVNFDTESSTTGCNAVT
jgi:prepilin-type N-terminal cleavage/methylation domain-containing protein